MATEEEVRAQIIDKGLEKIDLNQGTDLELWIGNEDLRHGVYIGLPNDKIWDAIHVITENGKGDWYLGDVENSTGVQINSGDYSIDEFNQLAELIEDGGQDELRIAELYAGYTGETVSEGLMALENDEIFGTVYTDVYDFAEEYFNIESMPAKDVIDIFFYWLKADMIRTIEEYLGYENDQEAMDMKWDEYIWHFYDEVESMGSSGWDMWKLFTGSTSKQDVTGAIMNAVDVDGAVEETPSGEFVFYRYQ